MGLIRKHLLGLAIGVAACLTFAQSSRADIVYSNATTRSTPERFAESGYEFGDEIVLAGGTNFFLTNFIFEYYGLSFSGNEQMRVRFYRNDGALYTTNTYSPDTMVFDSDFFSISGTAASTLTFDDINVPVPADFTWTVEFTGIEGGESAGLGLYNPPTVGSAFDDYWENSGTNGAWVLRIDHTMPLNFGAVANAAAAVVDKSPPIVTISSPPANFRTNDTFAVTGTAKDGKRVGLVLYKVITDSSDINPSVTNWIATSYRPAVGTTNWNVALTLTRPGTNTFYVKSVDANGNESKVLSRKFFLVVSNDLSVVITGNGSLNPANFTNVQLELGRVFTVTALPSSNHLFTNWTTASTILTTNPKLTFRMTSNLVLYATFITNRFIGAAGNYYGLFSDTNNGVAHESAGFIAIKTDSKLKFSGRLYLDGDTLGVSGTFNQAGVGTLNKSVTRKGRTQLDVALSLDLDGGDSVSGTVSNADWLSSLLGDRAVFNTTSNPATNFLGSYTAVLPGSATPGLPAGDGYEIITVATNGAVKLKGYVADALSHSIGVRANGITAGISKNGAIPFYAPLYVHHRDYGLVPLHAKTFDGAVMGWLSLTNGSVRWIKHEGWTNNYYTDGFTNDIALELSPYSRPPTPVLDMTIGSIIYQYGNLTGTLTDGFTLLSATNKPKFVMTAPTDTKSLSVVLATGELKGFFTNAANPSVVTPIRGALLQNQNIGRGFFAGTNETGSVSVQ